MKLSVVRGGGVSGIATRSELSGESLSPDDARTFRAKVEEAGLTTLRDDVPARPEPDDLLYEVTVEDGGEAHTVHLTESTLPEPVRALIAWADSRPSTEHGRA
jgi:hypothetical protein